MLWRLARLTRPSKHRLVHFMSRAIICEARLFPEPQDQVSIFFTYQTTMRLLHVLVFVLLSIHLGAQQSDTCSFTLTGQIIDDHDNLPLEFATIFIVESGAGAISDADGRFDIAGLCDTVYTVRFSHIGCETRERRVRMDKSKELSLRLEHHSEVLETIELQASRIEAAGSVSRATLDVKDIDKVQGQAFGEALKAIPGVNAIQTGPAIFKPVIHGLHSNRILVIADGLRQESQQWGLDHAPEIDPFLANKITVVKGTPAVQYGADAVAGVVLIEPDTLMSDVGFRGKVAIGGMSNGWQGSTSALLEKGFANGFGLRWHGTLKRGGDKHAPDYNLTNTGVSETNTSIAAGYRQGLNFIDISYSLFSTEIGILRSAHIGNLPDLIDAIERGQPFVIEPFMTAMAPTP